MNNKLFAAIFSATISSYAASVSVYTLDEQIASENNTTFRFKVINTSDETLNGLELRYHVKQDSASIAEPDIFYMPGGTANWVYNGNDSETLIIFFPDIVLNPGDTLGGEAGYVLGMHAKNWGGWSKTDDPSQPTNSVFNLAKNVDVVSEGKNILVTGEKVGKCPVIQFVEVRNNEVTLQVMQLLDSDSKSIDLVGSSGHIASIDLTTAENDITGKKIWRGAANVQVDNRGEFWAECNGNMIAYFAYGWVPQNGTTAVQQKLWETDSSFVYADFDRGYNQGLSNGQYLALMKNNHGEYLDARIASNWKFYRAWEFPDANPLPTIATSPVLQYNEDDVDTLTLSWDMVEGAEWYHLIVMRDSIYGDTVVSKFTRSNVIKVASPAVGNYFWFADPLVEVNIDEQEDGVDYFNVSGDDAFPNVIHYAGSPVAMRKPWYKKLGSWAKKTAAKAVEYFAPVVYALATDKVNWTYLKDNFFLHTSPFGIIQIFTHTETVRTKIVPVNKNMTWLQYSYKEEYLYQLPKTSQCLGKDAFCAMKDTRMMVDDWHETGFNGDNWNKLFTKEQGRAVHNRCWLTMAQMINHKKGGSISTDEILFYVRDGLSDSSYGGPIETMSAINHALGLNGLDQLGYSVAKNTFAKSGILPSVDGWYVGAPPLSVIVKELEQGNVIGVSQLNEGISGGHSMVLNGYKIMVNGEVYVHLLNTDNLGNSEWRRYTNVTLLGIDVAVLTVLNTLGKLVDLIIKAVNDNPYDYYITANLFFTYYVPPMFATGISADGNVFFDSDSDGVVNFDEYRFGIDPDKKDSDGDGINDSLEIYHASACRIQLGKKVWDIDGDKLGAPADKDSDGDGFCDDQENGYLGSGISSSCNRFDASDYPKDQAPRCAVLSVPLVAKNQLRMNDRSTCVDMNENLCTVVSLEKNAENDYGVSLGVSAKVGSIISANSVLMRDRSVVQNHIVTGGNVVKQSSTVVIGGNKFENIQGAQLFSLMYGKTLAEAENFNKEFSHDYYKTVKAGETVYYNVFSPSGALTSYLFNSNSELIVDGVGARLAGSLSFQANSKIRMTADGNIEFHVGESFQWNGTIVDENMVHAARNIIVYYYGTEPVFIQSNFAGTIIAPHAKVVVGQSGKEFYGAIQAKEIVIHQNTKFIWVPYVAPENASVIAMFEPKIFRTNQLL